MAHVLAEKTVPARSPLRLSFLFPKFINGVPPQRGVPASGHRRRSSDIGTSIGATLRMS